MSLENTTRPEFDARVRCSLVLSHGWSHLDADLIDTSLFDSGWHQGLTPDETARRVDYIHDLIIHHDMAIQLQRWLEKRQATSLSSELVKTEYEGIKDLVSLLETFIEYYNNQESGQS